MSMTDHATTTVLTTNFVDGDLTGVEVTATERGQTGPLALPTLTVTRLNRLLTDVGLKVDQDWRTQTHRLRAGRGQFCTFRSAQSIRITRTNSGDWADPVLDGTATGAPATVPATAPVAPALTPSGSPATPASVSTSMIALPKVPPVIPKHVRTAWKAARAVHTAQGERLLIALVGPTGTGKTTFVQHLAQTEGLDVVKFDASGVIEPGDWFGTMTITEGGTFRFIQSDLLRALTEPGERVLLIDEANRATGRAAVALLPVLDGTGSVTVPQLGQSVLLNPKVQIVLTMNLGSAYMHTDPLDPAFANRIAVWLKVGHLTPAAERRLLTKRVDGLDPVAAANIAQFGALVRDASERTGQHGTVSTRQLLAAARLAAAGMEPKAAIEASVLNGFADEGGARSEQNRVRVHMAGITWGEADATAAVTDQDTDDSEGE